MFSVRFKLDGMKLVWAGWSKEIMKDLGQTVEAAVKNRVAQGANANMQSMGTYKTNVGRNKATKGRRGKKIILRDRKAKGRRGKMLAFWTTKRASKTRVRIMSSPATKAVGNDTQRRYNWSGIDPHTHTILNDRVNYWVDFVTQVQAVQGKDAGGPVNPADHGDFQATRTKGKRIVTGQPVFL
jgi:hypothetical protein